MTLPFQARHADGDVERRPRKAERFALDVVEFSDIQGIHFDGDIRAGIKTYSKDHLIFLRVRRADLSRIHSIRISPPDARIFCFSSNIILHNQNNFKALAKQCAEDICSRGKVPILAGGTGLYIDMLIKDVILPEIRTNPQLRAQLSSLAQQKGNEYLHRLLASFDPQAAAAIHPNNVKRVVRAIEIYRMTQVTMSEWNRRSQQKESDFDAFKVYLDFERDVLYERINARVDEFMSQGLVEEARELYAAGLADAPTASQAIGYKELLPYLSGQCTLEEATDQIKQNTRNYAKRQETYFARMDMDMRLDAGEPVDEQTIETIAAAFESPRR